ncbi:hypothetical protein [Streptomyces coffeae]|uniref:Uncharacterized protein n=1 Tax=Streptomyces coffeae TaxID=621382 RepID=A0ABS1NNG1_9ACTN|nr:hypothetical protein [Streptomyces coffeae]MBL1101548.1 hypothetical protein [Streptomyces coffeae]
MNESKLSAALTEANTWIGQVAGVVAVGQGEQPDGTPTIDVWVTSLAEVGPLPDEVGGYIVRVRETGGPIKAQ